MAKLTHHPVPCNATYASAAVSPVRLELNIVSDPANLREVRREVEQFAAEHGCDECCRNDIGLCVNEALANVMRHAYRGATDQPIGIQVEDLGDRVRVRIRDWGRSFDPAVLKDRPYDPLEPGGLGVICMHKLMDEVTFVPQEKGMLLTLVRRKCS
jgi:serine/threonine-protein kinase RsbW